MHQIQAIYNIKNSAWEEDARRLRKMGHLSGPLTPAEIYYRTFKGKTCKKYGFTACR